MSIRSLFLTILLFGSSCSEVYSAPVCSDQTTYTVRRTCFIEALTKADNQLNITYQSVMQNTSSERQNAIREAQRHWIASRNRDCEFKENVVSDKAAWLDAAVSNPQRASCLIEHTVTRTQELSTELAESKSKQTIFFSEVKPIKSDSAYTTRSKQKHNSGKFYFEVVIDQGVLRPNLEADIQLRIHGGNKFIATTYNIRPQDQVIRTGDNGSVTIVGGNLGSIRLPKTIIGVAVDLDKRRFYRSTNGDWIGKSPITGLGETIPNADGYFAEITSSVSLDSLVKEKIIKVNFGDEPFTYSPPIGYSAFDDLHATNANTNSQPQYEIASAGKLIEGLPLSSWIQRYWQWSRSFPSGETPADDSTGERCNAGQTGPVFFLTGSQDTAPISRVCSVAKGHYVFIPLINVLAQLNNSTTTGCDQLIPPVRQVNDSVEDLKVSINGEPIQITASLKGESGCFDLRDSSRNISGKAIGAGYWLIIKPIQEGSYDIQFKGRYRADGFSQDIHYQLQVEK